MKYYKNKIKGLIIHQEEEGSASQFNHYQINKEYVQ